MSKKTAEIVCSYCGEPWETHITNEKCLATQLDNANHRAEVLEDDNAALNEALQVMGLELAQARKDIKRLCRM
jgi:hypothetical protein